MTPIAAMVLAFEAAGGDEPIGFEGRLLAALHSLGWGLVPFVPEYDLENPHEHSWIDPGKTSTFCRECGAIRKDEPGLSPFRAAADRLSQVSEAYRAEVLPMREALGLGDPDLAELARLGALQAAVVEYLAVNGSDGLYDAGRMISARNTIYLLIGRAEKVDKTHAAFVPDDIVAMGVVMARVRDELVR